MEVLNIRERKSSKMLECVYIVSTAVAYAIESRAVIRYDTRFWLCSLDSGYVQRYQQEGQIDDECGGLKENDL